MKLELLPFPWQTPMRRDGGSSDLPYLTIHEMGAHSMQASAASRERLANLLNRKGLYISGHRSLPGSVHLPYISNMENGTSDT